MTLDIASADGAVRVSLAGHPAEALPATSVFPTVAAASRFFELGALGYSATREPGRFDGMELRSEDRSLVVDHRRSTVAALYLRTIGVSPWYPLW